MADKDGVDWVVEDCCFDNCTTGGATDLSKVIAAGQQIADRMLVGDGTPGPPRFACVVTINGVDIRQDLYEYEIETLERIASMYDKKHRGRVLLVVRRIED